MSGPTTRPIPLRQPLDYARGITPMTDEEKLAQRETDKELVKEAITEWLDARFAEFGKWSAMGIAAAALALIAWWLLISHGWKAP